MSKEEILEAIEIDSAEEPYYTKKEVHAAMDVYAKEVAIGFNKWVAENYSLDEIGFYHLRPLNRFYYNQAQLYQQYLKSK